MLNEQPPGPSSQRFHTYNNFFFFQNFLLIYKLNIPIQISLIIGYLYSVDLITGISSIKNE